MNQSLKHTIELIPNIKVLFKLPPMSKHLKKQLSKLLRDHLKSNKPAEQLLSHMKKRKLQHLRHRHQFKLSMKLLIHHHQKQVKFSMFLIS